MSPSGARRPLLPGRGVLRVADFCQATGLDAETVAGLVADGSLEGLHDQHGRLVGLIDEALPSADGLRAKGLIVNGAYDPRLLRSYEAEDQAGGVDDKADAGPRWSMQWPQ